MELIHTVRQMQELSRRWSKSGATVSLVPTMGFLHEGHLSLVDQARDQSDRVVVSIFVNPTQFGPNEDFERYPRDEEGDLKKLRQRGVDAVFSPSVEEMYPENFETYVETTQLPAHLCGLRREGHFKGVTTVVLKLFNACLPDVAVFGEKDYQQLLVIRRMARDLNLPVSVLAGTTVREQDGLAMSSRNAYLSGVERTKAPSIYRALLKARELTQGGETEASAIRNAMMRIVEDAEGRIDYVAVVDPDSLTELDTIGNSAHAALAVYFGKTRLIDNMRIKG